MQLKKEWFYIAAILGLLGAYVAGLFIDLMDIDAAQYGSISMEMMKTNSYLVVKDLGHDYLDKPPLLFWLSALSFKLFGIHNFSYKLPSLLVSLLGFYSTYRFARLYYDELISRVAALMMAASIALLLINNDIRTDTILMGSVIFATWQLTVWARGGNWLYGIGSAIGLAGAMMAKGPIGLMVPVLGLGADWLLKKQWRNILNPKWILLLAAVLVLLAPMLYGLHLQFDGYGWYFYFWAQSFGRLTGQNPFVNTASEHQGNDPTFFAHTLLWSFLPWSAYFVCGYYHAWFKLLKTRFTIIPSEEIVSLAGITLPFIALTMSAYKLHYYIYVVLPFVSIISANALVSVLANQKWFSPFLFFARLLSLVMILAAWLLVMYIFPTVQWFPIIILVMFTIVCLLSFRLKTSLEQLLLPPLLGFVTLALAMNLIAYPAIMQYQPTHAIADRVNQSNDKAPFYAYKVFERSLNFYAKGQVTGIGDKSSLREIARQHAWLYTNQAGLDDVLALGFSTTDIDTFENYRVAKLTLAFLNPSTRNKQTDKRFLIKF